MFCYEMAPFSPSNIFCSEVFLSYNNMAIPNFCFDYCQYAIDFLHPFIFHLYLPYYYFQLLIFFLYEYYIFSILFVSCLFIHVFYLFILLKHNVGEGNGTPLQYSCLENPMDGGAWWAAVHGVTEGRTRLSTSLSVFTFMHWRRKWQPTPVFLPGESQGQGSLVDCRLWGCTESDTTKVT